MRLTAEDLARNPRLRAAVSRAVAADLARDVATPVSSRTPPARTGPQTPQAGRAGNHRCPICELLHPSYAAAERHADATQHARIEFVL